MQTMVSRTLLFNPTASQKEAYGVALEAINHLIQSLKPGSTLSSVYKSTLSFISGKNKDLANKVHANFGFGIGIKYKEDILSIKEANDTVIEAGMVFHARITFKDIEDKPEKSVIAIGDTVVVTNEDPEVLTQTIPRKYNQISYIIENEEEEKGEEEENGD